MREICLVRVDKTRPALVLTREAARGAMTKATLAPITGTIKGLSSEAAVFSLDRVGGTAHDSLPEGGNPGGGCPGLRPSLCAVVA